MGFKGRKKLTAADRKATIEVLASGVEEALLPHEIKVDLKNPTVGSQLCIMLDTLNIRCNVWTRVDVMPEFITL